MTTQRLVIVVVEVGYYKNVRFAVPRKRGNRILFTPSVVCRSIGHGSIAQRWRRWWRCTFFERTANLDGCVIVVVRVVVVIVRGSVVVGVWTFTVDRNSAQRNGHGERPSTAATATTIPAARGPLGRRVAETVQLHAPSATNPPPAAGFILRTERSRHQGKAHDVQ